MSSTHTSSVRPAYDPHTGAYELSLERVRSHKVSTILVLSLSAISGDDPREMSPLGHSIDPEVLDRHVSNRHQGAELSFEYHDHHVRLRSDGHLEFTPIEDA